MRVLTRYPLDAGSNPHYRLTLSHHPRWEIATVFRITDRLAASAALFLGRLPFLGPVGLGKVRHSEPAQPKARRRSVSERRLDAERRRARYDLASGKASTLKKVMRLRRIENGTQGFDNMGWPK